VYFPRTKNRPTRPNLDRGSAAKGELATGTTDIMTSATIDVPVHLEMPHMSSAMRTDNALREFRGYKGVACSL
jgi:hypothetical protein